MADISSLVQDVLERLYLKATCAASQPPLLAERLSLGLSLAIPRRGRRWLHWFLEDERLAVSAEEHEEVVALCSLLVSETALVHYTPKPKGLARVEQANQDVDEKYWKRRYNYFARFDEGVRMDPGAWFEVTPESVARHIADRLPFARVVDGTCGVGGNAIQFAMTSSHVTAVDTDQQRLDDARHNAKIYGVADRISFVHDDFADYAEAYEGPQVDAVFLSPPWGGPGHLECPYFSLRDVQVPDIVRLFRAALKMSQRVVLYLPRHTDLHEMAILAQQHGFPAIEVEKVFFQHPTPHLKLILVYFSQDALRQGIPKSITQKTVGSRVQASRQGVEVPNLLSSTMSGTLLRAVYCRSYLGHYVVRLAMQLEKETHSRAPRRQAQLRQRKSGHDPKASQREMQKVTAQQLCEAFGRDEGGFVQQMLAEVPVADALKLAQEAKADFPASILKLGRERYPEAYRRILDKRKAEVMART